MNHIHDQRFQKLAEQSGLNLLEDWVYCGTPKLPQPELPSIQRLVDSIIEETCQHLTNIGHDHSREQIERYWKSSIA